MARGAANASSSTAIAFYASAVFWAGFAIAFKLSADAYDGLLEKCAVLATMLWTIPLALLMLRSGTAARSDAD